MARTGFAVEVVCGSDEYVQPTPADLADDPRAAGVVIRRVPRLLGGPVHRLKLLRQVLFYVLCFPLLVFRRRPDVYVTQTNPPLLVPMVALAGWLHGRPFVVIAQDIYPEVMFAHGMARKDGPIGRILGSLFAWAYRRARAVVALGEVMADRLVAKGVQRSRIAVISNWATGDESLDRSSRNDLREEWQLTGRFVILYSGNLGIAHDVETVIAALKILLTHSQNVRLVFIGQGSRIEDARRAAEEAGVLHAVQFRPFLPANRLPQSLGLADIALVTLRDGFQGLVVPSKVLGYMCRGIPTLYIGPYSDIEAMLTAAGGGECFRNGAAEEVARYLRTLIEDSTQLEIMGAASARYYRAHFSRTAGLERYLNLIDSIIK